MLDLPSRFPQLQLPNTRTMATELMNACETVVVEADCNTRMINCKVESQNQLPFTKYCIDIHTKIRHLRPCWDFEFEQLYGYIDRIEGKQCCSNITITRENLKLNPLTVDSKASVRNAIIEKLSSMKVPAQLHESMMDKIVKDAVSLADSTGPHTYGNTLYLAVSIHVTVVEVYGI